MDGVLLIDKPGGLTSHDVVARVRRLLRQRSVGHTGTLDPMATGLLVLVLGQATRLASLLSGHDKGYEATIRLGQATTTDDAEGEPSGGSGLVPPAAEIRGALESFQGTFLQTPPVHSAKKIAGTRAYKLARANTPVVPAAVKVTVRELTWVDLAGTELRVLVRATAGFYVRSLAREVGTRLGCGAHLSALRRVTSGPFSVGDALPLTEAEAPDADLGTRIIAPAAALPELDAVELTDTGLRRALHGNTIGPEHVTGGMPRGDRPGPVRLMAGGRLVALARLGHNTLHPVAVLG